MGEAEWCWGMDDFWIPVTSTLTLNTGIWVSPLKKQDRCGVRLKWCREPEGLIEHIELWFSGLSRCYEEWQGVTSGLSGLMVAHFLPYGKHEDRAAGCPLCLSMLPLLEVLCVYLSMHNDIANINPYGDNLCGCSLHFSYLSKAVRQGCGVMR